MRGARVLEIGCGRGAFAAWLAERGADVTAADFSEVAVTATRELLGPGGKAVVADVQALPWPAGEFDLVVSLETLEHVPHPLRGLSELVRVTRTGGRLLVTTPNYAGLMGLSRVLYRMVGRRFTELGQPINQPLMLHRRVRDLGRLGCRVEAVEGSIHTLSVPGCRTLRIADRIPPQRMTKWFARHGLTLATKL